MKLSPHFSLAELTRSDTAAAMDPPNANTPTKAHMANLIALAHGMELVRSACGGRAITITSGYRNPTVNRAVGGVRTSAHALGLACDFRVAGVAPVAAAHMIIAAGIEFDQLIHETSRGILHISFSPRSRGQQLTQAGPAGSLVTKGIA